MPKQIPGVERAWHARLMRQKWIFELLAAVPPLIAGVVAATKASALEGSAIYYWSIAGVGWLAIASLFKVAHTSQLDKDSEVKHNHDGLRACVLLLQSSAAAICKVPVESLKNLRVTIHRVVPPLDRPEFIEQLVAYAGGTKEGQGRKFSVRTGITGYSVRNKCPYAMHRPPKMPDDEYRAELTERWGYTTAEALALTSGVLSCIAIPLFDASGEHSLGVIYLDSHLPDLFVSDAVQEGIIQACSGIISYVSERYGK